jgi:hypothetical protein
VDETDSGTVTFELKSALTKDIRSQVDRLVKQEGWPLKELREDKITMEETFIALTRASMAESRKARSQEEAKKE